MSASHDVRGAPHFLATFTRREGSPLHSVKRDSRIQRRELCREASRQWEATGAERTRRRLASQEAEVRNEVDRLHAVGVYPSWYRVRLRLKGCVQWKPRLAAWRRLSEPGYPTSP